MEKIGLFDFTTNFCGDKVDLRKHPAFSKSYPAYMVNRVLSMSPKTVFLALFMSQLSDMPDESHYAFLTAECPNENIYFNYYKRSDEIPEKTIGYIQEYYECSMARALEYIRLMSKKQIDTILDIYKIRDKHKNKKAKS
jgi:hypothetical protein